MGLDKWTYCWRAVITALLFLSKFFTFAIDFVIITEQFENYAPVAQLDRAFVYGTKGLGFESPRVHQLYT